MDLLSFVEELITKNDMKGTIFRQHNKTDNITAMLPSSG
jgi:hypothetical protein